MFWRIKLLDEVVKNGIMDYLVSKSSQEQALFGFALLIQEDSFVDLDKPQKADKMQIDQAQEGKNGD